MWILSRLSNDSKVYLLCNKPQYTVGRNKACDIIAEATQSSLGRFHATLHPYEDRVDIVDTESKYGTYVNEQISTNVKLEANTPHPLKDGDTIRFGFIDFTWKLTKTDIVALTSTLADNEKESLKKDIAILGGRILDQWSDTCTHLVVKNLTFTVKVLHSLCHAIPIVKPEYFKALLSSIRIQNPLPKIESFEPPIVERPIGTNVSLQVNIDRKRLFAGKTFIFMSHRHMEQYQAIIECGMGQCWSLDKKKLQRKSLIKPGVIVISNTAVSTQSQLATEAMNDVNEFLQSKGFRMVPESEITLAILNCSLEKFCNPKHTLKDNYISNLQVFPSRLLADDTPVTRNEVVVTESMNSINVPETVQETNLATTVDKSSVVIDLIDDDDDMLVQCLDDTMKKEETSRGKRKNASNSSEGPLTKKPHLEDQQSATSAEKPNHESFKTPQHSTRSSSRIEKRLEVKTPVLKSKPVDSKIAKSVDSKIAKPPPKQSKQPESISTSSVNVPLIENAESEKRSFNDSQKSQDYQGPSPRKRIAHRQTSSTFTNNDSDSDEEFFKFTKEPPTKKSKRSNESDSDSGDNMSYPLSSRYVPPITVPNISLPQSQSLTQSSQITADSWLSRPTPSQCVDTATRSKPKKRPETAKKPNTANISAGWQIGQYYISTQPIRISTQGWCSKDALKSKSLNLEMKEEIKDENEKSAFLEATKWIDTIKSGIQVITKSMNLITTSGKVFKKQQYLAPTEVIKTSKIYKF